MSKKYLAKEFRKGEKNSPSKRVGESDFRRTGSPNKKKNQNLKEKYTISLRLKKQLTHMTDIHRAPDLAPTCKKANIGDKTVWESSYEK